MGVNNSLVEKKETISTYFMKDMVKAKIIEMVGKTDAQRFMTSIISAVSSNSSLQECDYGSIVASALLGESLKLSPSAQLGQYFMVPYNVKTGQKDQTGKDIYIKKAQFQLGYKGYIQLALRSGQYKDIDVMEIREGEYLGRDTNTGKYKFAFLADEEQRENAPIIGYMAYFEYITGFTKTLYWSKEKMLNHADRYSQAFNKEAYQKLLDGKIPEKDMWKYSSYWYKDFDGMAFKTMLRQLISKWGIMSIENIELRTAMEKDMATINEDGSYEYVENDSTIATMTDSEINAEEVETTIEENAIEIQEANKTEETTKKTITETKTNDVQAKEIKTVVEENVIDEDGNEYEDPFAFLN